MVSLLNDIEGMHSLTPKGTMFAFPKYDYDIDAASLAMRILDAGVVCTPGTAFGKNGEHHLRFSFATSKENIKEGLRIVAEVFETLN